MCKGTTAAAISESSSSGPIKTKENKQEKSNLVAISLSSYHVPPSTTTCVVTSFVAIAFLTAIETIFNKTFFDNQHLHPLLEIELNRNVLARHLGVDVLACFICALLGYLGRHIVMDSFSSLFGGKPCNPAAYDKRLFTYHPESFRLSLFFFAYQVKNLYDTIKFNDGPEFIFHHIFSMITACAVLDTRTGGVCNYYSIFFFGLSEISTAVLCVLANFDDVHGVPGLSEAFPAAKVAVGVVFIVLFILCRCIMWPICSYRVFNDIITALKTGATRKPSQKRWVTFICVSCSLLSILQAVWLVQIIIIGKEEITNFLQEQ